MVMSVAAREVWLDTANRIAARLLLSARWNAGACTWDVLVPERVPGERRAHVEPAGGTLYQGSSGIALFLTELHRHSATPEVLAAAAGGLRHALAAPALPATNFGFYSGRVGLAYACYRFARVTGQEEWMHHARETLAPLSGRETEDRGWDVIGGAAGAIPILLQMADHLPRELTRDMAIALGETVLRAARPGRTGWSWPSMAGSVRDLTGFAHGASGFGHALTELYQATGDSGFRFGAEQAFAYERRFFDPRVGNWPDFRCLEIFEYVAYGLTRELRNRLARGPAIQPFELRYMSAWCHGAPGIGLARLRALEVFGGARYADEAVTAAETTRGSVRDVPSNYSLCHGYFGNCETLLYAARLLARPELRAAAEVRALVGREQLELMGRPWACGTLGGVTDPSLMLGEAGIGYFYLRLYDETTPCILCLAPGTTASPLADVARDLRALRRAALDEHFGTTLRVFERLLPDEPDVLDDGTGIAGDSEGVRVFEAIQARIRSEPVATRAALLGDVFAVERARFNLLDATNEELAADMVRDVTRLQPDEVPWHSAQFRRDEGVAIVRSRCHWPRWVGEARTDPPPTASSVATAVWRSNGVIRTWPLSSFATLVLECTSEAADLAEITGRVAEHVERSAPERLASAVLDQVKHAYAAGLLCCLPALAPAGAPARPAEAGRCI